MGTHRQLDRWIDGVRLWSAIGRHGGMKIIMGVMNMKEENLQRTDGYMKLDR